MYLWNILKQGENELIRKVFNVQKISQTKGDWFLTVKSEREKYDIGLSDEEIFKLSKNRFKNIVNKKVNTFAYNYLKNKASKHEKSLKILDKVRNKSVLKRQEYLKENRLSKTDCQLLFKLRSKMTDVKTNFSHYYNNDVSCRTCEEPGVVENEEHLLVCKTLQSEVSDKEVKFDFVYQDIDKQTKALAVFKSVLRKREIIVNLEDENH